MRCACAIPCIVLPALLCVSGCGGEGEDRPTTGANRERDDAAATIVESAAVGYVDDQKCVECHGELSRAFHHVGMGQSFYRWSPQNRIESLTDGQPFRHEKSDRSYEMVEREGELLMRRWQRAADGERINEIELRVDWVIGSGHHARSYLHQTEAGELYELPVTWYTQEGGWHISPGYDLAEHAGVTRLITRECLFCHNAYPDVATGADVFGAPLTFPHDLPQGIGCQRCHGPGAKHVEISRRANASTAEIRDSIVNPANLEPRLRDDVCLQCHLQPSTAYPSIQRRFGAPYYAYQPGMSLRETIVHLDYGDAAEKGHRFEINHHAWQTHRSACFIESDGELTCTTCHDPHRKVPPDARAAHYRAACLSCHHDDACTVDAMAIPSHVPADDCIACHMQQRRTHDAIRVAMTDHSIPRFAAEDPMQPVEERGPERLGPAHAYGGGAFADDLEAQVLAYLAEFENEGRPAILPRIAAAVERLSPPHSEAFARLGDAYTQAGQFDKAVEAFTAALRLDAAYAPALSGVGPALAQLGNLAPAEAALRKAIEVRPQAAGDHVNLGVIHAATGRNDLAESSFRRAIEISPLHVDAHVHCGGLMFRLERFDEAASLLTRALAIDPRIEAYGLAGEALAADGRWQEATRYWRHGAAMTPRDATIEIGLATAFLLAPDLSLRDATRGAAAAEVAARELPRSPAAAMVAAVAAARIGDAEGALRHLERAAALDAEADALHAARSIVMHETGRADEARQALAELAKPSTPGPGDLLSRLLAEEAKRIAKAL